MGQSCSHGCRLTAGSSAEVKHTQARLPHCHTIITAGQLATTTLCRQFGTAEPKVGQYTEVALDDRTLRLYRMPSSSRAYPMSVEKKAEAYAPALGVTYQTP